MNRGVVVAASCAAVLACRTLLAAPPAAGTECNEVQWYEGAARANEVCPGASFTVSCSGNRIMVTIVACPP
jgi:hypothetical protein